jgi:hypothetical protein
MRNVKEIYQMSVCHLDFQQSLGLINLIKQKPKRRKVVIYTWPG